jgi:hypothetical protein
VLSPDRKKGGFARGGSDEWVSHLYDRLIGGTGAAPADLRSVRGQKAVLVAERSKDRASPEERSGHEVLAVPALGGGERRLVSRLLVSINEEGRFSSLSQPRSSGRPRPLSGPTPQAEGRAPIPAGFGFAVRHPGCGRACPGNRSPPFLKRRFHAPTARPLQFDDPVRYR